MALPLGQLDFQICLPDLNQLALAIQQFVDFGSRRGRVLITDLHIVSDQVPIPNTFDNIEQAVKHGTLFLDACMYFSLPADRRPQIQQLAQENLPRSRELGDIGKAMFVIYFYLLTRASPPARAGERANHPIPRFLEQVLGLNLGIAAYVTLAASFDLDSMDHRWIRYITFENFGIESLNRFGLGVAGYRMLAPFKTFEPRANLPQNIQNAITVARAMATTPPDWAIHPTTRDPRILANLGNINKNAANLILEAFTQPQIQQMVTSRMLFAAPLQDPTHSNFRTWNQNLLIQLNSPVFPILVQN